MSASATEVSKTDRQPRLELFVLRRLRLLWRGRDVPLPSRSARGILGYLALTPGMEESRERLATLLWSDSDETRARQNLRQTLHRLKALLPEDAQDVLISRRTSVALDTDRISTDEQALLQQLSRETVPDILHDINGMADKLLDGEEQLSETFASWVRLRRREFEDAARADLGRIMRGQDTRTAERAAKAIVRLDPSDEAAVRHLMSAAAKAADLGRALKVYRDLWDVLDIDFGMEPSDETQDLLVRIKQGVSAEGAPPAGAVPALPELLNIKTQSSDPRPAVRIEPLVVQGDGSVSTVLPSLLRNDLLAILPRFRMLRVLDGDVGDHLADYLIRLTALAEGGRITLLSTIVETTTAEVIWSHRAEHVASAWQGLRETLAGQLAAACDISLSRARLNEITSSRTARDAIDEWLLGEQLLDRFRPSDWAAAEVHFRNAITHDPGFSKAYSSLSQVRNIRHLVMPGQVAEPETLRESLGFANRAVSTDPFDARAHLCRAWASMLVSEFAQSETSFELSLRCNSDDPWTVISAALGYAFLGDRDRAGTLADRFNREGWTTSQSNWGYHANIRFLAGDLRGCVEASDSAGDGIINLPAWAAAAHALIGDETKAIECWTRFEAAARTHWSLETVPTTQDILNWFLSLFPIREQADRDRLAQGATRAANAYLHCVQE